MSCSTDTDIIDMFEQLRPRLRAISWRIVGSEAEAEDIVQDCFLKWQGTDHAAVATPAAWLTTVVQHQSIDRLRKRAREAVAARTALELVPEVPPVLPDDGLLRRADLGEALARLLACLSPRERLVLVLHDVFECEHGEIAATLGMKAVNTRQYLTRARRRLREYNDTPASDKLCRALIRRFQAAISSMDLQEMVMLLGEEQPVCVPDMPRLRMHGRACANDAFYGLALAA